MTVLSHQDFVGEGFSGRFGGATRVTVSRQVPEYLGIGL